MVSPRMLSWNLPGKRVFVRCDLNTDLDPEFFAKSLKLQRSLETLYYLKERGAKVTLATHIGRPSAYNPAQSTQQLTDYFIAAGFSCLWSNLSTLADTLAKPHDIILLENLRFYPQEEQDSIEFALKISRDCNFFIEDGFGVVARNESSIITTAELFDPVDRSIGFLIKNELEHLQPFQHAKKPYMVIVGGGKGLEKLQALYNFFDKATHIALGPGLSELPEAQNFIEDALKAGVMVLKPIDYLQYADKRISIGPKTFELWQPIIKDMRTIVYNGMMGMLEDRETTVYTKKLFELFMHQTATEIIIAGGDTSLAAQLWKISAPHIYVSTGGGSTLAYLSNQHLPGLEVVSKR